MRLPRVGSRLHVVGKLSGLFEGEDPLPSSQQYPAIRVTDCEPVPSTGTAGMSSSPISTPTNTPPRASRLRFGPPTTLVSPTTQAETSSSSHTDFTSRLMSTIHTGEAGEPSAESSGTILGSSIHPSNSSTNTVTVDDPSHSISDSEDAPRSSKRRRIQTSKAKAME
jgi:hypothetical protein